MRSKLEPFEPRLYHGICISAVVMFITSLLSSCGPGISSLGPDAPAGLMLNLAGDSDGLYAVSLNAGVWTTAKLEGAKFKDWQQLRDSPRYSHSVAVDPNDPSHIVVGERNGDALPISRNQCGLWESFDGGLTWPSNYYFDPRAIPGVVSQAIPSVAFTPSGTLLAATSHGVARKLAGAVKFDPPTLPQAVTALAVSQGVCWAANATTLFHSVNDGKNWTTVAIPSNVSTMNIDRTRRGDAFALAAFDDYAFLLFAHFPSPPIPNGQNYLSLLTYDISENSWRAQHVENALDGTGTGGRRFLKAYVRPGPSAIGQGYRLFASNSQEVYEAVSRDNQGFIEWNRIVATGASSGPITTPKFKNAPHNDLWDFHLSKDGQQMWVGTDGGVYTNDLSGSGWQPMNGGLLTHHVHGVVASGRRDTIAYCTQDNDAPIILWPKSGYMGGLGDANWIVKGGQYFVSARHFSNACLRTFPPKDKFTKEGPFKISNDLTFNGTQCFAVVRPAKYEIGAPWSMTVVMLARLPLQYRDATGSLVNVPGPLGQPSSNGAPVLLRNRGFNHNPDINVSKGAGWELLLDGLPAGAAGFWLTGGALKGMRCYVYSDEMAGPRLFRRDVGEAAWTQLSIADMNTKGSMGNGPVFVNPYDKNMLYVATRNGIAYSTDGGSTFQIDAELTGLVSGQGTYPLDRQFPGGNGLDVVHATQANPMCPLSAMDFSSDPERIAAASPYTGVFVKRGSHWHDVSGMLPKPYTPISSLDISGGYLWIGTEGRGVMKMWDMW